MLNVKCMIPLLGLCLVGVTLMSVGCTHNSMTEPNPTAPEYEITGQVIEIDSSGREIQSSPLRVAGNVETEKAKMTGLGFFSSGVSSKVVVTPKSGYAVKGLFFRYDGGYNSGSYPTSKTRMLNQSSIDIRVVANITVIAVVEDSTIGIVIEDGNEGDTGGDTGGGDGNVDVIIE